MTKASGKTPARLRRGAARVLLGALALFAYMLLFRPEQKKRQEFRSMLDNLKEKDRVVTVGAFLIEFAYAGSARRRLSSMVVGP